MKDNKTIEEIVEEFRMKLIELDDLHNNLSRLKPIKGDIYFDGIEMEQWLRQALQQYGESIREEIKNDYIDWVLSSSYEREYKAETPFWEWKQLAEVKDMQSWK